jgi:MinD-like ATPase involved in chromosome partitioning or flagellar assembly
MDKLETPTVITAIADPDFEGLVSSALFNQGWSVIARALDMKSLEIEIAKCDVSQIILIYSSDLPGISLAQLQLITKSGVTLFGFADAVGSAQGLPEISPRPTSPAELLAYIRGNIRSPSIRTPLLQPTPNLKARIIGVGSASHSTGTTSLALNLAQESALLGAKTLLIDANFQAPAIATLLDLRKVSDENKWRDISENLSISEITQQKATGFNALAIDAAAYFDLIYIDLGTLANLSTDLTDRRWASQVKIWVSNLAQNLIITSTTELLQQRRLKDLQQELSKISIAPSISLAVLSAFDYRKRDSQISTSTYPMTHIWQIPYDARATSLAIRERTTLAQVSPKSALRKAFLNIANQITD